MMLGVGRKVGNGTKASVWVARQQRLARRRTVVVTPACCKPRPPINWPRLWWRTLIGGLVLGIWIQYEPPELGAALPTWLLILAAWGVYRLTRKLPWLN